jgi:hypothetical protein
VAQLFSLGGTSVLYFVSHKEHLDKIRQVVDTHDGGYAADDLVRAISQDLAPIRIFCWGLMWLKRLARFCTIQIFTFHQESIFASREACRR